MLGFTRYLLVTGLFSFVAAQAGPQFFLQANIGSSPVFTPSTAIKSAPPNSVSIKTFKFSADVPIDAASGHASGKTAVHPLTITRQIDSNSPTLFQDMVTNKVFSTVVLTTEQPDIAGRSIRSLVYTLKNVHVSSLSHDETLTEKLVLQFASIQMTYRDPGSGHTATGSFDRGIP